MKLFWVILQNNYNYSYDEVVLEEKLSSNFSGSDDVV